VAVKECLSGGLGGGGRWHYGEAGDQAMGRHGHVAEEEEDGTCRGPDFSNRVWIGPLAGFHASSLV
jgi:hypothetical protein